MGNIRLGTLPQSMKWCVVVSQRGSDHGRSSDAGEMARTALLESLSAQTQNRLPSQLEQTPQEVRNVLASFTSGQNFAHLARDFFARLSYRSRDYYLSGELANHTGTGKRYADDADRTEFALSQHTFEASRIVLEYAGGWYGKTVWKEQTLSQDKINDVTRHAFKKMRPSLAGAASPTTHNANMFEMACCHQSPSGSSRTEAAMCLGDQGLFTWSVDQD